MPKPDATKRDPAARQRASRAARQQAGGKAVHAVLSPLAASRLAMHVAAGRSVSETLSMLLEQSSP